MESKDNIKKAFSAAQTGDAEALKNLLKSDPTLANAENSDGLTVLGFAAHFGHKEAVKVLLDQGADVNAVSHSKLNFIPSNTALHASIAGSRNMDVIKLLLKHKTNTNIFDSNGHTCLHTAAFHDDSTDIIQLLIEHGADVNAKVDGGTSALNLSVHQGNTKVSEFLRKNGAMD